MIIDITIWTIGNGHIYVCITGNEWNRCNLQTESLFDLYAQIVV